MKPPSGPIAAPAISSVRLFSRNQSTLLGEGDMQVWSRGHRHIAELLAGLSMAATIFNVAVAGEPVDMQLVIAADVSTSMDAEEKALQQRGFVEAFRRPEIIEAIAAGRHGRIAVTYVEWGATDSEG
ncbi:hypothetical protein AJ87_25790 [Rhizobium yanglingense]|nr:hypothetical protein AJ87_25790 [Rhizobium yanglingense]